jgi:hypothetical protein
VIQDSGFRIQDSGFRIQDSGFRKRGHGLPLARWSFTLRETLLGKPVASSA